VLVEPPSEKKSNLMKKKSHLTPEGLEEIKSIKSKMNLSRK